MSVSMNVDNIRRKYGHTMNNRDLYQEITDRVIEMLERGVTPWQKDWKTEGRVIGGDLPRNFSTGRAYNGMNVMLLWGTQLDRGYKSPLWGTYKQISEAGGQVRKGERSTVVVFWKQLEVEDRDSDDGDTKRIPLLRAFNVFNVEQCDGLNIAQAPEDVKPVQSWERDVLADEFVKNCGAVVKYNAGSAYYSPLMDYIGMPEPRLFKSSGGFYATMIHELAHWTGHKSRLNRTDFQNRFGSDAYAFEELVAELGAAFTCAELGLTAPIENHVSYLDHWLKVLKNDKRAIFTAASKAAKAAEYLKALQPKVDTSDENLISIEADDGTG